MSISQGLCVCGDSLYLACKGETGNDGLFYASFDGAAWKPLGQIPGVGSSVGPSLAGYDHLLYAAWKGAGTDQGIWYASFDVATSTWSGQVPGSPQTEIPNVGTGVGPALATFGDTLAAIWRGQDADERLWWAVFDGTDWLPQAELPGGFSNIGAAIAPLVTELVAAWRGPTNDQNLYFASYGGTWMGQTEDSTYSPIPGVGSSHGPSLAQFQGRVYAAWIGEWGDEGIYYASYDGGTRQWMGQTKNSTHSQIPGVASSIGPCLAVFNDLLYAVWKGEGTDQGLYYATFDGSVWTGQTAIQGIRTGQDMAPTPPQGLGSNGNYVFWGLGEIIKDLSITINITEDIAGSVGFGFQLNAYSPKGNIAAWQQYILAINDAPLDDVAIGVDNWPVNGPNLINNGFPELHALLGGVLPAGYKLVIALLNDAGGKVSGVTYEVFDNDHTLLASRTVDLLDLTLVRGGSRVMPQFLAPIIAFELNLVGPANGLYTELSSGAGTITYEASYLLEALPGVPANAETGAGTAETASSLYGLVPLGARRGFHQSFSAISPPPG